MNFKFLLKTLLFIALLGLLVVMGLHNPQTAKLSMPPLLPKSQAFPAAIMYFGFFGTGFLSGAILMAGGKKGGGKTSKVNA